MLASPGIIRRDSQPVKLAERRYNLAVVIASGRWLDPSSMATQWVAHKKRSDGDLELPCQQDPQ